MIKAWINKNLQGDPVIWSVVFFLGLISILVVYSATGTLAYKKTGGNTEHYLFKHASYMAMGFVAMWFAHKIDYRYYSKISLLALWISLPLLLLSWKFGSSINEASRWLHIPGLGITFQPSDLAKFALVSNLASMLAKRQSNIDSIKDTLVPMLLWCGAICGA
ncbi:MAG: FtsW/RodA/SpoVE family cell cycle protein, partial [Cytophagales bacterium]